MRVTVEPDDGVAVETVTVRAVAEVSLAVEVEASSSTGCARATLSMAASLADTTPVRLW